jgi:hypothetical protein
MQLAGCNLATPVVLSPEKREAIARSKAAAGRDRIRNRRTGAGACLIRMRNQRCGERVMSNTALAA